MIEVWHVAGLALAAVSTCCTVVTTRGTRFAALRVAAALVMMIAMADSLWSLLGIPTVLWAVGIIGAEMVIAGLDRAFRSSPRATTEKPSIHRGGQLHRSLGSLTMVALLFAMSMHPVADGIPAASHHSGAQSSGTFVLVSLGFGVLSLVIAVLPRSAFHTLGRLEAASMGGSVILMAASAS